MKQEVHKLSETFERMSLADVQGETQAQSNVGPRERESKGSGFSVSRVMESVGEWGMDGPDLDERPMGTEEDKGAG